MADSAIPAENSSSLEKEPIEWVKKSTYRSDNEVRILSKEPVRKSTWRKVLFLVVGLSITVIGGAPAISGGLPDLARAALLVGGLVIALFSFPKVLWLVTKLLGGGPPKNHYDNAIANRRVDRRHRFNKTLRRGRTIYRIFK